MLRGCADCLGEWFENDIGKYSGFPFHFPEHDADGLVIRVDDADKLAQFKQTSYSGPHGRDVHQTTITITDSEKRGTFTNALLGGYADVRLQAFRVFLNGAYQTEDDQKIEVDITHDGRDRNYTANSQMRSFSRPSLDPINFTYNGKKMEREDRYTADEKFKSDIIFIDGPIGSGKSASEDPDQNVYAGVGPFSTWTIVVDPASNRGLHLEDLREIEIQLVGAARLRVKYAGRQGNVFWHEHPGWQTGAPLTPDQTNGVEVVHSGWAGFKSVFASSDGVIYAIDRAGKLNRYQDTHWQHRDEPRSLGASRVVGNSGWASFTSVFASSKGVIHAIDVYGNLNRFEQHGDAPHGAGKLVGTGGWDKFKSVFASEDMIYAVDVYGNLNRFEQHGDAPHGRGAMVSQGWSKYKHAFASSAGTIYAIDGGRQPDLVPGHRGLVPLRWQGGELRLGLTSGGSSPPAKAGSTARRNERDRRRGSRAVSTRDTRRTGENR